MKAQGAPCRYRTPDHPRCSRCGFRYCGVPRKIFAFILRLQKSLAKPAETRGYGDGAARGKGKRAAQVKAKAARAPPRGSVTQAPRRSVAEDTDPRDFETSSSSPEDDV